MRPTRPTASPARGSTTTGRTRASTTSARATSVPPLRRRNGSTHPSSTAPVGRSPPSGKYVYATWVSTTRWIAYRPTAPRVLYLRRNSNHGAKTSWNTTKRLTSLSGRVDFPTVAAAGANVYVAYTDSGTGSVKVKISRDRAATWKTVSLGSTAWSTTVGSLRHPAHRGERQHRGRRVAVQQQRRRQGPRVNRCRPHMGRDRWPDRNVDRPTGRGCARHSRRCRLDERHQRHHPDVDAGAWSSPKSTGDGRRQYTHSYGAAVALSGTAGVGVAWTGCVTACETWSSATRANLVWSESRDSGASWFAGQVIGSSSASTARRYNDYPRSCGHPPRSATCSGMPGRPVRTRTDWSLRTGTGQVAATAATQAAGVPSEPDDDGIEHVAGHGPAISRSALTDRPGNRKERLPNGRRSSFWARDRYSAAFRLRPRSSATTSSRRRTAAALPRLTAARPCASARRAYEGRAATRGRDLGRMTGLIGLLRLPILHAEDIVTTLVGEVEGEEAIEVIHREVSSPAAAGKFRTGFSGCGRQAGGRVNQRPN